MGKKDTTRKKQAVPSMDKEERVIRGLASIVGLEEDAPKFDVLKAVAETLGLTVGEDGTTTLESDEEAASEEEEEEEEEDQRIGRSTKRAKLAAGGGEDAAGELGSDGEGELVMEEGEEAAGGEDGMELVPVRVEDDRKQAEVEQPEGIQEGERLFQWLISPVDLDSFEEEIEERAPMLVSRPHNRAIYKGLFSKKEIDRLLREEKLQYQYNIDVVSYSKSGTRENFNFNGIEPPADGEPEVADAAVVWRRFEEEDCSVRVLHPQRYSSVLSSMLARLEGYMQCCVGCNAYLTPAGTQGFAPHFDDVDVYILQVEGSKRWRLHAPADPTHVLPRFSSVDFEQEELGECVLDEVLQPGDLLYLPRGVVHQAEALPDTHSLHLTISTNQLRTWADFLGQALPRALQLAEQEHLDLRRSLPRDYFDYMGLMHSEGGADASDAEDEEEQMGDAGAAAAARRVLRADFREKAQACFEMVASCLPLDPTADQFAVQFLKARLPPPLSQAAGRSGEAGPSGSSSKRSPQLKPSSRVHLVQPGVARLVVEDGVDSQPAAVVYHCLANSRQQHAARPTAEGEACAGAGATGSGGGEHQRRAGKAPVAEAGGPEGEEEEAAAAGELEFHIACAEVVEALLRSSAGDPITVAELPEVEDEEDEEEEGEGGCGIDKLGVAQALADAGLLVLAAA